MTALADALQAMLADGMDAAAPALARELRPVIRQAVREATMPPYLTREKVIEITGWSARTLQSRISKRELPVCRRGRLTLIPTEALLDYIEAGRIPARRVA